MTSSDTPGLPVDPLAFLAGGGEMAERISTFDWSKTPLGPAASWSPALRMMVRLMTANRMPMLLWWGPRYVSLYNDPYRPVLGGKHPSALGQPVSECWSEIWHVLQPLIDTPFKGGPATWAEDILLVINRSGFAEETYWLIAYSPVPDESVPGGIGGVLATVHETTEKVVSRRRMEALRDLGTRPVEAKTAGEACAVAAATLATHPRDIPFTLLYLTDADGGRTRLAGIAGVADGQSISPAVVDLRADDAGGWPLLAAMRTGQAQVVGDLAARLAVVPPGPWPDPPTAAVVLPVPSGRPHEPAGFLIAGVSSRLRLDDAYRGFLDLAATHVGTAVANARAHEEEQRRAEALAELDRAKTAFFSNVSHEFRTPLTLMLGPVEDLLAAVGTAITPAAAGQLEVVNRNGLRLLRLVNSLLDFSRIEAGRVRAVFRPTDLAAFTADLASNFRAACERAGLRLVVDCPPLGEPAFVDRGMWEKVVLNLLSNAFKFTFDGEITVSLRRAGTAAELIVRDSGTGIPAAEMPRLFERFHRVENARGRTHEGSGIGLALVQELVRLHGGTIAATSEEGRGTSFTVTVPLGSAHLPPDLIGESRAAGSGVAAATPYVEEALRWLPDGERAVDGADLPSPHESPVAAAQRPEPAREDDRPRVLVADDNADMRQYVARLLADQFHVLAVSDGETALAVARDLPPALILTDVMMPRLDGFGLLRAVRADPRTREVPVVLLSARAGEESRVEGMEAGADDYIVKPFSARELLARVSALLQLARLRREAGESLRAGEERLRTALTAAQMVAWEWTPADGKLRVSENAADVFGLPAGVGLTGIEQGVALLHPDDVPAYRATFQKAIGERGGYLTNYRLVRPSDRRVVWIEERGQTVFDQPGGGVRLFGVAMDVTDRVRAEEDVREARRRVEAERGRLAEVFRQAPAFLCVVRGPDHAYELANDRYYELVGHRDLLGKPVREALPEVVGQGFVGLLDGVYRTGEPFVGTGVRVLLARQPGKPTEERYVDFVYQALRDPGGAVTGIVTVGVDVTDRQRAEGRLRASEAKYRTLFDTMDQGFCVVEVEFDVAGRPTDYRHVEMNPAFEKHTGLRDFLGLSVRQSFPTLEEFWYQVYGRVATTGQPIRFENQATPLGERWFDVYAFRLGGDGSNRVAVLFTDITDRKRAEQELRRLAADLSDADRRKDEFLATLAHELRNPLAPIRNGLQVIKLAGTNGTVEQARSMMDRQLTQLVRLVDDLLDVSRITRGKLDLRTGRVAVRAFIDAAVETARPAIEQGGHDLAVEVPDEPVFVDGDVTRLAQVVSNLLTNSAKYTHRGGHVRLTVRRDGDAVVVSVADDGIGIPSAMLDKVFAMFTQVDRTLEKTTGGLGIGLSLVKGLVEMHGGTIEARSEGEGKGSEFVVRLPVARPVGCLDAANGVADEAVPSGLRRVLVVDDNTDAADSLGQLLEMLGNEVRTAYDGEAGVAAAAEFRPDLIFLDLGMPKMNGYEAARYIRQQAWGEAVTVVALTGWGQDDDRRKTAEAGFDRHLVKPVEYAALTKLLADIRPATV